MKTGGSRSCWRSRCWTTQRSRTCSEKTSEACGAKNGGEQGNGAPRAESATRLPLGRDGSFDITLPGQAAGRLDASTAIARAGRGAPTLRLSALGLDARPRRSCDESQAPVSAVLRRKTHGAPAGAAQTRAGNPCTDAAAMRDQSTLVARLRVRHAE